MSHTNSTTNYNLPQFVGTDKPTWLNDVNGAFSAIDTQMKANADSATSASTSATSANTAIGTLSNLETTVKTDAVSAINEVNTEAGVATNTANQAYTSASSALTKVTALETALNLNTVNTCTFTKSSNISNLSESCYVKCATNSDKSLFKIYGYFNASWASQTNQTGTITISNTGLGTRDTAYTINAGAFITQNDGTGNMQTLDLTVNTDGTITITFAIESGSFTRGRIWIPPILYFNKSFGDVPQPNE